MNRQFTKGKHTPPDHFKNIKKNVKHPLPSWKWKLKGSRIPSYSSQNGHEGTTKTSQEWWGSLYF